VYILAKLLFPSPFQLDLTIPLTVFKANCMAFRQQMTLGFAGSLTGLDSLNKKPKRMLGPVRLGI